VVASIAMIIAAAAEATVVTVAASQVAVRLAGDAAGGKVFSRLRDLWDFYRPLSLAGFLNQASRSLVNSGIAMALLARASLAGYSVVWGFVNSWASPTMCLQQMTTIYAKTGSYVRVRNFTLFLSGLLTGLLLLIAATPLCGWVLGGIYNLSPELQDLARPGMVLFIPYPLVAGFANLARGVLIARGQTQVVRSAIALNILALCLTLGVGLAFLPLTGVALGAAATVIGVTAEFGWLTYHKMRLANLFLQTEPILEGNVAAGE
jgi:hypothetical protein